jgi:cell division transport system permease protein
MINRLIEMTEGLRTFSVGLILALILVSVFIISNTIKLAVEGRKDEIFIMKSVGATNGFIRGPFVVEGIILGIVGAGLSFGVLSLGYMNIAELLEQAGISFVVSYLIPIEGIMQDIIVLFGTLGIGIGALGSLSAVKKQLGRKKA